MNFLEKLVSLGIVGESQVPEINRRAKQKFGGDVEETLLSLGIDEDVLLKAKSEFLGIPYKTVNAKAISFDLLKYVPEDSADHYKLVPIGNVFIYPMGIFSNKIKSLSQLKNAAKVGIPNDPSNESRALLLLQSAKLIKFFFIFSFTF